MKKYSWVLLGFIVFLSSCKKYVEVDLGGGKLGVAQEYSSDASATAAVLELYSYTYTTGFITYVTYVGGMLADELQSTTNTPTFNEIMADVVTTTNSAVEGNLWTDPYYMIGEANLALDGLAKSTQVTPATKKQLTGEALFFRAFAFFHMVNDFGGVPLSLDPVQVNNALIPRAPADTIWAQIKRDLIAADTLLPATYVGAAGTRGRVNKYTVDALLARVYLYLKDYPNAEAMATSVIGSGVYKLAPLSATFINTSPETIFQLANTYGYTQFGVDYRASSTATTTSVPPGFVLYTGFTNSFEANDQRYTAWVDTTNYLGTRYYRINKYKLATQTTGNESSVILRLAEQFLIRAEARAEQNEISGAQSDLDSVRLRAGLPVTTASNTTDLVTAILKERKVELFGEFSHRWFDLKRLGQASAVLAPLKAGWTSTAVLLPIPYNQIMLNVNLTQNPGYN